MTTKYTYTLLAVIALNPDKGTIRSFKMSLGVGDRSTHLQRDSLVVYKNDRAFITPKGLEAIAKYKEAKNGTVE